MEDKLNRKRSNDMKYYYRKKLRDKNISYDSDMTLEEIKSLYYLLVKVPKKRKPKETIKADDHYSRQHYEALEEMKKEEESETLHIRNNLQEGISPLIKDKGGDEIPLSVINNPKVNLDQYLGNIKKGEKEKAKKSVWKV